jgi:uncharacterized cofD-like protein
MPAGDKKRIVVVGGGTGTHTVLTGLKRYTDNVDITAIIAMTDSGGSTGRLREEFGYLPMGDVRRALVALADEHEARSELLRRLFEHRFLSDGEISGHNLGNLFLIALTDIFGSEEAAVAAAGDMLHACGNVFPVTNDRADLLVTYDDGTTAIGEYAIDEPLEGGHPKKIVSFGTTAPVHLTQSAEEELMRADCIVFGPGDLYTSILANCIVTGFRETLREAKGTLVYIANLMTKAGQTDGMDLRTHVHVFERYSGRVPDVIFINTAPLPEDILQKYVLRHQYPVTLDPEGLPCDIHRGDLLAPHEVIRMAGDVLTRSLIHHDPDKIASAIMKCIEGSGPRGTV